MKKLNIIILLLFISLGYSQKDISNKYSETITQEDLQNLLEIYSSDEFEGRQTGDGNSSHAEETASKKKAVRHSSFEDVVLRNFFHQFPCHLHRNKSR